MKNIVAEEYWRYNSDERMMMADAGITVIPEPIDRSISSEVVLNRTQAEFQRSFMRVTYADGSVTDGNGKPVVRRRM